MKRAARIFLTLIVLAAAAWVQACRVATRAMNPDENQFVASAALLAREGKWPYLDFPYMHLPYQTIALAGLYRFGGEHLLLVARIMNGTFGVMTLAMLGGMIVAAGRSKPIAWMLAAAAALALLFNPLFAYTSGLAWNHDGSVFLLLASVTALWRGFELRSSAWIGVAGLLLSGAVGVRSTIAPMAVPMTIALLWQVFATRRMPMRSIVWFVVAGVLAHGPTLVLFAKAPEQFVWGNLGYARMNTQMRADTAFDHAMSVREKVGYLREVVFPWNDHRRGDLLLLGWSAVMAVMAGVVGVRSGRRALPGGEPAEEGVGEMASPRPPLLLFASLIPFGLFGAMLPTPSWVQYYYILVPLLLLAAGCAVAHWLAVAKSQHRRGWKPVGVVAVASLLIVVVGGVRKMNEDERGLRWPTVVVPLQVHSEGVELARLARGSVWTVDPIYPLEGGRSIHPAMVPGSYAYRVAHLMSPAKRKRLTIVAPEDLPALFAGEDAPSAVLVREPRLVNGRESREDDEAARSLVLKSGWTGTPLDPRHTLLQP